MVMDRVARLEQVRSRASELFSKCPFLNPRIKADLLLALIILPIFKENDFQKKYIQVNRFIETLEKLT